MNRKAMTFVLLWTILCLASACGGTPTVHATPSIVGTWQRGNERGRSILAFVKRGDEYLFRWSKVTEDEKRRVACEWDGRCVETVNEKAVGAYTFSVSREGSSGNVLVACTGYLDEGKRIDMQWVDEFVLQPDGQTLYCYTREANGQRFEGDARPLRVFQKVSDSVAEPPRGGA